MHINKGIKPNLTLLPLAASPLPTCPPILGIQRFGMSLEGDWVTRMITLFCIDDMIPSGSKWITDAMRVVREFSSSGRHFVFGTKAFSWGLMKTQEYPLPLSYTLYTRPRSTLKIFRTLQKQG